jgi:hypothetical protein
MSLRSKLSMAVCLLVILLVAVQLIGLWVTMGITMAAFGLFVHNVGWRRAIFPFVSNFGGH